MKTLAPILALGLVGCASAQSAVQPAQISQPAKHLMLPACKAPPYPKDEGNPDSRARWLVTDGQCDALNRTKIEGLQDYARAVSRRRSKP